MKCPPLLQNLLVPALLLAVLPTAQLPDNGDADPPSRVARLAYMSGPVSFRPGDVDDWADATVNYPLRGGDHLWTDADARAEIALGSTVVRLAPQTAFGFLALDDRTTQVDLSQGALEVRLRHLADGEVFEIDTPNSAVSLIQPGTYRVDVDSAGDATDVTVRGGQAEVTAAGSAFSVQPGQTGIVTGTDSPSYDIASSRQPDDWEDWCSDRDRRWDESRSVRYVSPDVVGYEDLDEYGDWHEGGQYGAVWVPRRMESGWAPYRYGHWAWVDPWGWTWIDDAPWGFAPFHYGRWVYEDGGWGWVPGHIVARPVYAPALVVFVGGPHWNGGGGVAWFPLGPGEVYRPVYHASNRYVRNVNVTNVNVTNINITNIHYVNRDRPGAVTSVTQETFVGARPVGRNAVIVPRERLAGAVIVGSAAPIAPTRVSVLGRGDEAPPRRPPPAAFGRPIVVRSAPPPAPLPFSVREHALQSNPGHPLDQAELGRLRAGTPAPPPIAPVRPALGPTGTAPVLHPVRGGLPPPRPLPPNAPVPPSRGPVFAPKDTSNRGSPPPSNATVPHQGRPVFATPPPPSVRDTSNHRRPPSTVRTGTAPPPPPSVTPPSGNGAAMGQSRPATTVTKKPPPKSQHPPEHGDTTKAKKPEHDNP